MESSFVLEKQQARTFRLDKDFWEKDFVEKTQNGIKPFLFKKVLDAGQSKIEAINQAFRKFQDSSVRNKIDSHGRIYIDEDRHEDLLQKAMTETFTLGESLDGFLHRVTGRDKFGLIINNFEQICPELAADIGKFLYSMFLIRGAPIGGCEQVVFAGNYSGTAFGVHEGYEHAFLTHFGPGTKDFYCWSQDTYLKMTKGSREPTYGDYNWMLEYGEKFILEPGDALYLPALVYHVGKQKDFSISVAVPLYTYPKERFFSKVIVPSLSALMPFNLEGMSDHVKINDGTNPFSEEFLPIANTLYTEYMKNELNMILSYRWHRLVSNGFWEIPNHNVNAPFDENLAEKALSIKKGNKLKLISPYRISWEKALNCQTNELRVFIRSVSIAVPYKIELIHLLERLNNDETITLTTEWEVLTFLALSKTNGLQVIL